MKYYHNLFISEGLKRKKEEILLKIDKNQFQFDKYVIVLSQNEKNHLDIYNSAVLLQKYHNQEGMFVVGIASGFDGALELVEKITQTVYNETKGTDIRGFLIKKQQEFEESKEV